MDTNRNQSSQAEIFKAARAKQAMSLREFGAALDISHQGVSNLEEGIAEASNEWIARWMSSPEPWIRLLGMELFASRYHRVVDAILTA